MNGVRLPQLVPDRVRAMSRRLEAGSWEKEHSTLAIRGSEILEAVPDDPWTERFEFSAVQEGEEFGELGGGWQYRLFRVHVPAGASVAERYLFWDCDGEATVFVHGQPWAGIDVPHRYCSIPAGELDLSIAVGTYQRGIWIEPFTVPADSRCRFRRARTAVKNLDRWNLYWDFEILAQLMDHHLKRIGNTVADGADFHAPLDRAPVALRKILARLDTVCDAIDMGDTRVASALLAETYTEFSGSPTDGQVALVGHSHLDQVWLWPERVTYDKAIHTTATALRLMERYPELVYAQSTPHQYDELEKRAPDLWNQVCELIGAGRWEATGGMYVESDVSLPSGEGLARSLLFGQQRFIALTGKTSSVLWLPDVFGYPSCLPQLMQLSGIDSFYTTKLSWSTITRFPYTVFNWRSPDGSRVVASQSPVGYNESVTVDALSRCIEFHQQTGVHDTVLLPVGYGDGGGGITEEMLESARRLRSLTGVPAVTWTTVEGYFKQLGAVADELPEYEGELYLEYHRGTLTTQGRFKHQYRACERALQLREAARAFLGLAPLSLAEWRRLLFAQFHDALPGSSIGAVYVELQDDLGKLEREMVELTEAELSSALRPGVTSSASPTSWVFNPIALRRLVVVETAGENPGDRGIGLARCSGLGLFPVVATDVRQPEFPAVSPRVLDNGVLRAEFSDVGTLESLTVRGERLKIQDAGFVLCRDYPANYDAWEVDYPVSGLLEPVLSPLSLSVAERSAVRAVLEGRSDFGDGSVGVVRYVLPVESDHLLLELEIEWAEEHRLLQYFVATAYHGRDAVYGEPFGSVRRRQVPGLPSDTAKWEVPGQRWAAVCNDSLSEGLAIVTEAKYGFSCADGVLRTSLLRATADPDPEADRGKHTIRFAVGAFRRFTDDEGLSTAAVAETMYAMVAMVGGTANRFPSELTSDALLRFEGLGSLTPSWVKPAEDGAGPVVRLHECAGESGKATLVVNRRLVGDSAPVVFLTDILEQAGQDRPLHQLDSSGGEFRYSLAYNAYEIITVKIAAKALALEPCL